MSFHETAAVTIQASRHTGRTITAELSRLPIITGSFVPSIDQLFVILFNLLDVDSQSSSP